MADVHSFRYQKDDYPSIDAAVEALCPDIEDPIVQHAMLQIKAARLAIEGRMQALADGNKNQWERWRG